MDDCVDCPEMTEAHFEGRAVDNSTWDGPGAMSNCASSDTPGSCYRSICAGRKDGDPALQSSWALPHHKTPGAPPNAAGVRNCMSRISQTQGLTNRDEAQRHLDAHMAAIQAAMGMGASSRPPRDELFRALRPGPELRESSAGSMPTMHGHFAVFDQWTEIDSIFEGRFLERIDHGAFAKTFKDNRDAMRALFQHGRDPQVGDKPLGPIDTLEEDRVGAYYEVPLLDTSYNRDLLPGLEAGLYGASFRFRVMKEELEQTPKRSPYNPDGLPERTIKEAMVMEFGPVTFPAYAGASAGVRSLTDFYLLDRFGSDPDRLLAMIEGLHQRPALPGAGAEERPHSDEGSRDAPKPSASALKATPPLRRFRTREEYLEWIRRI